jgi:hypothetical protein
MTGDEGPDIPFRNDVSYASLVPRDSGPASHDLQSSLAGLSQLLPSAIVLEELLTRVAEFAVAAIPGAAAAGVTLLQHDRPDTIGASAPCVTHLDAIQCLLGEGPCITAAAFGARCVRGRSTPSPRGRHSVREPDNWVCAAYFRSHCCCPRK